MLFLNLCAHRDILGRFYLFIPDQVIPPDRAGSVMVAINWEVSGDMAISKLFCWNVEVIISNIA